MNNVNIANRCRKFWPVHRKSLHDYERDDPRTEWVDILSVE